MNDPKETQSEPKPDSATAPGDASANPSPKKELTPEEQMALYEESLKETDWGHQPC